MDKMRFFNYLLTTAAILVMTAIFLFFQKSSPSLVAQNVNEYRGPKTRTNEKLVRVQILINDDPGLGGVTIEKVKFNKSSITLKPADVYGFRGEASFQVAPGTYRLKWSVKRDDFAWPRTVSHEEEVNVDPRDLWIQVTITGETAAIT